MVFRLQIGHFPRPQTKPSRPRLTRTARSVLAAPCPAPLLRWLVTDRHMVGSVVLAVIIDLNGWGASGVLPGD